MTEHQCARTLIESDIEIATTIRAVPLSVPHARATQLLMYTCRHRRDLMDLDRGALANLDRTVVGRA